VTTWKRPSSVSQSDSQRSTASLTEAPAKARLSPRRALGAIALIATAASVAHGNTTIDAKVIYGADNRRDYYAETNPQIQALADSTVALIFKESLRASGDRVAISGRSYGASNMLCTSEPFYDQSAAAFCSGFLVAPNTMVTAGHCITNNDDCAGVAFVFGYRYNSATEAPSEVSASEVYSCKRVVHTQHPNAGADFAVVELDRPVVGHQPLAVRQSGSVQVGDELVVIGHPSGLPTKIADGAKVRTSSAGTGYFVANLDTYGGNSGSAVFNAKTLEVEGILVRGEADFKPSPKRCYVSNTCTNDGCRGEDVTRITEAMAKLPGSQVSISVTY
jgi:V8-like Glu-specific endopeptidase